MADFKFLDKTRKQKITMERNIHAKYFYIPDKDLYEVHCSLNDYAHDVAVSYFCDLKTNTVVDCQVFMDMTPETICGCAPALVKRIIGMDITKGFTENILLQLMGKNGCENIAELFIFSGRVLGEMKDALRNTQSKDEKQKLKLTRNLHATYYYHPDKDQYEIKSTLSDNRHDVTAEFMCDMNKGVVTESILHVDHAPDELRANADRLAGSLVGVNLINGFDAEVFMKLLTDDGNEDLAVMYTFAGSAIAFVWVRHLCESGKLDWSNFGNTIFPIRINTCIAFNPTFDPKTIGAE